MTGKAFCVLVAALSAAACADMADRPDVKYVAHQGEEFEQGMPTDLAFRTAARHTIFKWLEKHQGEGWWGTEKYADYYGGNNPFAWIQFHPFRRIPTACVTWTLK